MKFTIGKKIGSGFGILLIMMLVLGSSSFYFLSTIKDQFTTINEAHDRQELGLKILDEFGTGIAAIRGFVAYGDEKFMQQLDQAMKNTIEMENQIMAMAREEKKKDAVQLIEMTTKYRDGLVNDLAPVVRVFHQELRAGNITRALELEQRSKEIAYSLIPITEEIHALLQNVSDENGAIVVSSFEEAFDDANAVQGLSLTIALVALIVGLLLSIVLTRMFRNPILALVGDANQMAAGDLSHAMEVRSADEVGELGQALRTMQANFRDMIQQIKKSTDLLHSSSEQLSAGAEQAALATNQVVEAISSVAGGTEKQLDSVGQTATVVSEISAAIDLVVADAQRAEGAVQRTTGAAREGGEAVTAAIKQMGNIEATTLQTVEVVAKLGEHSKEIGLIVDTISGIASQTNLLALNAAIEAARAGESGRGFAVVAEEVRKLAEQSQEAAHQIATLISEVQGETDKAVAAMNSGAEEVKAGTEVVNKAGGSFTAITRMVDDVSREVQHIAEVIQQVAEGANRIVAAVDAIETVSKDTAGQAQTVSAATEEQSATMEEITASSQSLAQMAGELQTIVNKFVV